MAALIFWVVSGFTKDFMDGSRHSNKDADPHSLRKMFQYVIGWIIFVSIRKIHIPKVEVGHFSEVSANFA